MISLALAPWLALGTGVPAWPVPSQTEQPIVVSTEWLAAHSRDPGLVIFEVGMPKEYAARHIPGAQHLDFHDLAAPHDMSVKPMGLALELPSTKKLDSVLSAKGVSNDSRVIVYFGNDWVTIAAREVLTLEYAGLRGRVSLLDGGLPAWVAEKRPVTKAVPVVTPAHFTSQPRSDVVVTVGWLSSRLKSPAIALIDARDAGFYLDTLDNEMPRGGHIPGAANVPFSSLTDDQGKLLPREELAAKYQAAGAAPGKLVVGYCHIGQQASLVFLVARYLGYDVRLYDGSFQEWSERADLPVEGAHRKATGS